MYFTRTTHGHSKDEKHGANVCRKGEYLEGREEGEANENGQNQSVHLPGRETHSTLVTITGLRWG